MTLLLACDLDGTLIYSQRRAGAAVPAGDLVCVEALDGRPISFLTRAAYAGLLALNRSVDLVAVTARSVAQYGRVSLPMSQRYAVLANGGMLVEDGVPDAAWSASMTRRLREVAPLGEVLRHVEQVCDRAWTKKITVVESMFCCAVVDADVLPQAFVPDERGWAEPRGWRVSLQGSKFYVVPQPLDKSAAVAEVARRMGADTVLAAGDALLDADLLRTATRGVHPSAGELATTGWSAPRVTRVPGSGVAGGEQIVDWLRAEVSRCGGGDVGAGSPATPEQSAPEPAGEPRTAALPLGARD